MSKENKVTWFPVAFLVVFDMEISCCCWWAALPNLVPRHTISYLYPAPRREHIGCQLTLILGCCVFHGAGYTVGVYSTR